MRKILLAISSLLSLGAAAATSPSPAAVEMKTERQELRLNCTAIRDFVQITDASVNSIAAQINAEIRREMTVGKRLREEDCPEAGSGESFEYHNRAQVSGQRHGLFGVQYDVYFPGGSGRFVRRCSTFELATGHLMNLKLCLSEDGQQMVQTKLCPDADSHCLADLKTAAYCLSNDGLTVSMSLGRSPKETAFTGAQLHKMTTATCPL